MLRLHERLPAKSVREAATSNISAPDCSGTAVIGAAGLAQRTRVRNPALWGQGPHPGSLYTCAPTCSVRINALGSGAHASKAKVPPQDDRASPPASAGKRAHLWSQDQGHGQKARMALKSESQMREQDLC